MDGILDNETGGWSKNRQAVDDVRSTATPSDLRRRPEQSLEELLNLVRGGEDDQIATTDDGRTMRRVRNREAVIVAMLQLIREGDLDPSVAAIADRAAVSHRSVFRYFDDLNDLVRAAIDYELRRALPLADLDDIGVGPIERRVDAFVDSRLRIYAATFQVGRVARLRAAVIPAVDDGLRLIFDLHRGQMRVHFATELAAVDESTSEFVLDAVMVQTGFESYDIHRRILGHGTERIRLVWNRALLALLVP